MGGGGGAHQYDDEIAVGLLPPIISKNFQSEAVVLWPMAVRSSSWRFLLRVNINKLFEVDRRVGGRILNNKRKAIFGKDMSTVRAGRMLQEVVKRLEDFSSTKLAEKWDNVGLLVEPSGCHVVKKIVLTNDFTQEVLAEAIEKSANMIISYHPPIFVPLKRLIQGNWKERILVKAAENRIAIYSPHTSFDAIKGGVNDWLISCFGGGDIQPIFQSSDPSFSAEKPNGCYKMKFVFSDVSDGGVAVINSLNKVKDTVYVHASAQENRYAFF